MQKTEKRGGFTAFAKEHGAILIFLLIFLCAAVFIGNFFTVRNVLTVVKQAAVPLYDDPALKRVLQEFDGKIVGVEDGDD